MLTTTRHSVRIPPDRDGFTGRECPIPDCERYFKVEFGTGLKGSNPCHCPYCGHVAPHDRFWTKEQIAYAKSVVFNEFTKSVLGQLKRLERRPDPHAATGSRRPGGYGVASGQRFYGIPSGFPHHLHKQHGYRCRP